MTAKPERLAKLKQTVAGCQKCFMLAASRTQTVFGTGDPDAEIMFVGEAPGEREDLRGEPFIGPAGRLLTTLINMMGFKRADVYIANVLCCRPDVPGGGAGNRKPSQAEMSECLPYLRQQIDIVQPKVIISLGATALDGLVRPDEKLTDLRGNFIEFNGIPLMPTFHPAYVLRNRSEEVRQQIWHDCLKALASIGYDVSDRWDQIPVL